MMMLGQVKLVVLPVSRPKTQEKVIDTMTVRSDMMTVGKVKSAVQFLLGKL